MKQGLVCGFLLIAFLLLSAVLFYFFGRALWEPYYQKYRITKEIKPQPSKQEILDHPKEIKGWVGITPTCYDPQPKKEENLSATQRLNRYLAKKSAFIRYPERLTLIGLKYEQRLEVWGLLDEKWYHIHDYPFSAFSGRLGPKLEEGDRQIPEGIYRITYLNPKSKFHLSMRLNYPNAFDRRVAKRDGRVNLGGDIMIHGSNRTVGCIPIGDEAIEELYALVEKVGITQTRVILAPIDFRVRDVVIKNDRYPWIKGLYRTIKKEMEPFAD